ncbi:FkbM family methyltransferase [Thermodesulfobacteriota bacterium]
MRKNIKHATRNLLIKNNINLNLVDVGSRNGILHLADYAEFTRALGFEPNPEEYEKLLSGKTDASAYGIVSPDYKEIKYYPYAISNQDGKSEFYVTPGPGAAGLLEPNMDPLNEIHYHGGRRYEESFGKDVFDNFKVIEVETKTLDTICEKEHIKHIDLLKIDVEGTEYEVLEGARSILQQTGVIFVETCFIPFRKNQKLFSHVDLLLRDYHFDLLHYEIVQEQLGYKVLNGPSHYIPPFYYDPHGQPLSCDAVYINRNIKESDRILCQALILLGNMLIDEALYLLEKRLNLAHDPDVKKLHQVNDYFTPGQQFRHYSYKVIDKTAILVGKMIKTIKEKMN